MAGEAEPFVPLVKGATTSQSPNVRSVMDEMGDGTYVIPDYQRDSSQWDLAKKPEARSQKPEALARTLGGFSPNASQRANGRSRAGLVERQRRRNELTSDF